MLDKNFTSLDNLDAVKCYFDFLHKFDSNGLDKKEIIKLTKEQPCYFKILDNHIKRGGIITADNVTSHSQKVKPFLDAIFGNPKYQSEILDLPAGLLIARKNED